MDSMPARLLAQALNGLLSRQPMARARLQRHAGKHVILALPFTPMEWVVSPQGDFDLLGPETEADSLAGAVATLTLIPQPSALPAWVGGASMQELFRAEGDGVFAADIAHALGDFDWVLALRPYLGDMAASRMEQFFQGLGQWRRQAVESTGRNLAEYAVHEAGLLAEPHATREFIAQVDRLREDADRLAVRLQLLEARQPSD